MTENYPEHKKLIEVQDRSQAIHEFFEFLEEKSLFLSKYKNPSKSIQPAHLNLTSLVAEFLGIDQDKIELEKRAMLEEIRKSHES